MGNQDAGVENDQSVQSSRSRFSSSGRLRAAPAPADYRSCPSVTDATAENAAYFELPPGGAQLGSQSGPVQIGISRFARGKESVPLGTVPAGGWAELRTPADAAPDPWLAVVKAPVYVCPLH